MARKTRDKVLEASLELFNARGVRSVTTAEIARTVGINEGNLYYYFQKKEQLVTALFVAFEAEIRVTAAGDITRADDPAVVVLQFHQEDRLVAAALVERQLHAQHVRLLHGDAVTGGVDVAADLLEVLHGTGLARGRAW